MRLRKVKNALEKVNNSKYIIINPKEWDYKDETSYRFSLTKGEKIIFSIRKILGNKEEYTRNLDIDK